MLKTKRIRLSKCSENDPVFYELFEIFSKTLNENMTFKEFRIYYFYHVPHYIDLTFLLDGPVIVGFISATFYKHQMGNKFYTICRGAIGVLEKYRCGALTGWQLCKKYIAYKLRNSFEEIYVTAFITNPIMYSMICKYACNVYPNKRREIPNDIFKFKNDLLELYRLRKKEVNPFVVKLHFHVPLTDSELKRIYASVDEDLIFFLSVNANFQGRLGLLIIIPVNYRNVIFSITKALLIRPITKNLRKLRLSLTQQGKNWKPAYSNQT